MFTIEWVIELKNSLYNFLLQVLPQYGQTQLEFLIGKWNQFDIKNKDTNLSEIYDYDKYPINHFDFKKQQEEIEKLNQKNELYSKNMKEILQNIIKIKNDYESIFT